MSETIIPASQGHYLIAAHSHYDASLHAAEPPIIEIKLIPIVAWSIAEDFTAPITSEGTDKSDGSISIFDQSGQETELQIHGTFQYDKNIDQVFEFGGRRVIGTLVQYRRLVDKELNKAVAKWREEYES